MTRLLRSDHTFTPKQIATTITIGVLIGVGLVLLVFVLVHREALLAGVIS